MKHVVRQLKKPWNILKSKKDYGLKISQSNIYAKEHLSMVFSTLEDIIQAQKKKKNKQKNK